MGARRTRWIVLGSAVLACAACADDIAASAVTVREMDAAIQTDALAYRLARTQDTYDGVIRFSLTNRSSRALAVENCLGATAAVLEQEVGGDWVGVWSPVIPSCLSQPIVIAPGAAYAGQLSVGAGRPGTNYEPKFSTDRIPGVYRLVWGSLRYIGDTTRVPRSEQTSNRFSITVGR